MTGTLQKYISTSNDKMFNIVLDWRQDDKNQIILVKRGGMMTGLSISVPDYEIIHNGEKFKQDNETIALREFRKLTKKYKINDERFRVDPRGIKETLTKLYPKFMVVTNGTRNTLLSETISDVPELEDPLKQIFILMKDCGRPESYLFGKEKLNRLYQQAKKEENEDKINRLMTILNFA